MSATNRSAVRRHDDVYETPPWTVKRLLEEVQIPGGLWLEPCAGSGDIMRAVNEMRSDVAWQAIELREECAPALGSVVGVGCIKICSFLDYAAPLTFSAIVTNPPYGFAAEFLNHALPMAPFVAFLLRLNWLASHRRCELLREHMPDVYVLPNRPSFTGGRTDATEYAWMVWHGMSKRTHGTVRVLGETPKAARKALA